METDSDKLTNSVLHVYDTENKNGDLRTEIADMSFGGGGRAIRDADLERVNYDTNIYVGAQTTSTRPGGNTHLGCMASIAGGTDAERFRVDLGEAPDRDSAVATCERAAHLANQPYFAVGTNASATEYACYIGDDDLISQYDKGGQAVINRELATYNTLMMRKNMGLGETDAVRNEGGYMKVEDGNLKIYTSAGTLVSYENTEFAMTSNLYSIREDVIIQDLVSDVDAFKKTVIACSDSVYMNRVRGDVLNEPAYKHMKQYDLDASKTHTDVQTICNDLSDCVGYQYIKADGEVSWILFNDTYADMTVTENATRMSRAVEKSGIYLKPETTVESTLVIEDDGRVILKIGGNDVTIMKPDDSNDKSFQRDGTYANTTLKDGRGVPRNYLQTGEIMLPGQFISSPNGVFRAKFNSNGVLVLEVSASVCPSDTTGRPISYFNSIGENADSVYFVNDYRYSAHKNKEPKYMNPGNVISTMERVSKIKCMTACNNDSRCESFGYYNPGTKQHNCELYGTKTDQLKDVGGNAGKVGKSGKAGASGNVTDVKDDGSAYMVKAGTMTKESIEADAGKAGYLGPEGKLYTYSPNQLTYEYTDGTERTTDPNGNNNGGWRSGYAWNRKTYLAKKDMERLDQEGKYIRQDAPGTAPMSEAICADMCATDPECAEIAYYEKDGDKIECGIVKKGAIYDKIPSEYGRTYTRIPRVKNSETDISISRAMVNVGAGMWKRYAGNGGEKAVGKMSNGIKGPKAVAIKKMDEINGIGGDGIDGVGEGFSTIGDSESGEIGDGMMRRTPLPDTAILVKLLKDRKKVRDGHNAMGYAAVDHGTSSGSGSGPEGFVGETNNSRESSYTLYGDLKRAENDHKRTKEHTRAMHDTGYMELERQTAIMGNLAVLAVVTALFGASFLRSSASN